MAAITRPVATQPCSTPRAIPLEFERLSSDDQLVRSREFLERMGELGIGFVATHYLEHYLPLFAVRHTASLLVLSIGAGIYEELVFRLIAFTLLSFVFIDLMGMKRGWAGLLMVVSSSLLFSLYHYLGHEQFDLRTFAFRTAAGAYFGAVFIFRGFGITAGTHAAYDIYIVALRALL